MQVHDPFPNNTRPVLLIHGLGSRGSSWELQFQPLGEAGFRPIAPDLPGFGRSVVGSKPWKLGRIAGELAKLASEYSSDPLPVVGISLGGVLAQLMAIQSPAQVEKLILVNSLASLRPISRRNAIYLVTRLARTSLLGPERQAELVAWRLFPQEGREELRNRVVADILAADRKAYRAAMWSLAVLDLRPQLGRIQAPTLIISGAEDTTIALASQVDLARRIPRAKHVIVASAGHGVIVDQPARFNDLLLQFLCGPAEPPAGRSTDGDS